MSGFATVHDLEAVQAALGRQTLQRENAMRAEFSAVRGDMGAGDEETRRVLREEIRAGDEETRQVLGEAIRAGDEETRSLMRALHEDVIERIKGLGE